MNVDRALKEENRPPTTQSTIVRSLEHNKRQKTMLQGEKKKEQQKQTIVKSQ